MARYKLSPNFLRNASPGKHEDGGGLRFVKKPSGSGNWIFRFSLHGKRREMGLGSAETTSLAQARELADKWRAEVAKGRDPILSREKEMRTAPRADTSFEKIMAEAFEARKAELKDDGNAGRWTSPLVHHVLPKLGRIPVQEIDAQDIRDTLQPIWHSKHETARKALNRINAVIKHAAARGLDVDMQVGEKAKALLGQTRHVPKHITAMPWADVPALYQALTENTTVQLATRFYLLHPGSRTAPVRLLRLEQVEGYIWTVPGELMKGKKGKTPDFRVPLCREAVSIIEAAKPLQVNGFLFGSESSKLGCISENAILNLLNRMNVSARPHGLRACFRTWCQEAGHSSEEVAEVALAHKVGTRTRRSYARSDFLEERRALHQKWANFLVSGELA